MEIPCKFTTLGVNEGSKLCGIHHDPPTPLPALIAGNTTWVYVMSAHAWRQTCGGGRLFLADGLFDLSYGPRDVIILDGRFAHGVTTLRQLPGILHTTFYMLLTADCSLLNAYYLLLTAYHWLLTTHYPLPTRHSLLTTHYSLFTIHHSLLTTHYSLLTTPRSMPRHQHGVAARALAVLLYFIL